MSLAHDLINTLASPNLNEDDMTLFIDHTTRTIIIPSGIKNLGVENDADVLRLKFKMPRYLDVIDFSEFDFYIDYVNAQGKDYVYEVNDVNADTDFITFSWLVGATATVYRGTTKFGVRLVATDGDLAVPPEYNTFPASLPVLQGLDRSKRTLSK